MGSNAFGYQSITEYKWASMSVGEFGYNSKRKVQYKWGLKALDT